MENMSRASKKRHKKKLNDTFQAKKPKSQACDFIPDEQCHVSPSRKDNLLHNVVTLDEDADAEMSLDQAVSVDSSLFSDARLNAKVAFFSIIKPTDSDTFYKEIWERRALCINRQTNSFQSLFSRKRFLRILSENALSFGNDVTASRYNVELQMLSVCGETGSQANQKDLLRLFKDGHTLRLIVPHKYDDTLWRYLSLLEQELDSAMQTHAVLSPSEQTEHAQRRVFTNAFVLQLEGSSSWRLTRPRKEDALPRAAPVSDDDDQNYELLQTKLDEQLSTADDDLGQQSVQLQTFDYTLHPGDSLYIPRGWFFQHSACSSIKADTDGGHSLHLFVHVRRTTSRADLLEMVIPVALANYANQNIDCRRSVPRSLFSFCGVANSENDEQDPRRSALTDGLRLHLSGVVQVALDLVDAAVDQLAKQFICERLPVPLSRSEERVCGGASGSAGDASHCIGVYSRLRMLRPGSARAVVEDGMVVVYHCMDNSRETFGTQVKPLEFDLDDGPAIDLLLQAHPDPVLVSDLPHPSEDDEDKLGVARALFAEGFLAVVDAVSRLNDDDKNREEDGDPF